MKKHVFIATSLDGYIADSNNQIDWLHDIDNPTGDDCGFSQFIAGVDAIVMGRNTFETVAGFDCEWPYPVPVFVCSRSLTHVPDELTEKACILSGTAEEICQQLALQGFDNLYVDGGNLIQQFLRAGLIDEMTISTLPILLGAGTSLFGELTEPMKFRHIKTQCYLGAIVSSQYLKET
ncbi:dihydrofolate reductase family protein [Motilimonas pumila]|uniref:Dihydrofolate reductase n=1 Tax=Motilimonas pumila TaxID=2303987 RepID=A0A418YC31_9GAMM|nr:dihydrofolate reductase family protein [Motilimonas pumila]RJG42018.1 dihydrofolate reductase [Motilimonas pumila]